MNLSDYQTQAFRTCKRLPTLAADYGHAALGMTTECGEYATEVKRITVYGREPTPEMRSHMAEELADFCWYLALAATLAGINLRDLDTSEMMEEPSGGWVLDPLTTSVMLMQSATVGMWLVSAQRTDYHADLKEALAYGLAGVIWACRAMDIVLPDALQANIDKLRLRFPEKYTDELAEARLDKGGLPALLS